jgi:hypothetical protein
MLGFTSISEGAISQGSVAIGALGYLSTTLVTVATGTFAYEALANTTPSPATASFIANDFSDVDAKALIDLLSAPATFSINDFADVDAQATTTPTAITASFTVNDFYDVDAKANLTLDAATVSIAAYDIADADAQANTTLSSTSAYLTIYITDFADEDAQAKAFMSPAVAITNVDVGYDAQGRSFIDNIFTNTSIAELDFDAKANITTGSISISGTADEPAYIWGSSKAYPLSAFSRLFLNLDTPDAVTFDYEQFADDYSRTRMVVILGYTNVNNSTVYVREENRTVIIPAEAFTSRTIRV